MLYIDTYVIFGSLCLCNVYMFILTLTLVIFIIELIALALKQIILVSQKCAVLTSSHIYYLRAEFITKCCPKKFVQ